MVRGFLILRRVFRRLGGSIVVPAVALRALAAPPVLPTAQGHTAKLRTAVVVPTAEKTPALSPEADKKIEGSASKKLVIDQPPPEKPPPAPEPALTPRSRHGIPIGAPTRSPLVLYRQVWQVCPCSRDRRLGMLVCSALPPRLPSRHHGVQAPRP